MAETNGKIPRIGRGKNMSVAKAALIVFYDKEGVGYFYTGDLGYMHEIVDVAGAKHCSMYTAQQVASCLNSSPYWEATGRTKSWGNSWAHCYEPSKKGEEYYEKNLKQREAI